MEINEAQGGFDEAMRRLRADPPMSWAERQTLATQAGNHLRKAKSPDAIVSSVALLKVLADDQKWEVRKAVADALMHLLSGDFDPLITRLANDSNAWVRKAAVRTLSRRKRLDRVEIQKQQRLENVHDDYNWFVNKYGRSAADRALRIGERYFEILGSAATHEIRGVLTSLVGALDHLGEEGLPASERRKHLIKAQERAAFLNRILDDLKGYAQELSCDFRRENLREIVDAAVELVADKLRTTQRNLDEITLRNEVPDFVHLEASRYQLVQVFANIMRNAFEATDKGGVVTVTAELRDERHVDVRIADNGVGMSREEMKDAFIPFKTSKKNEGGTGFGLPIAKKIVEAHGGVIKMESEEDRGTTVTVRLPITQENRLEE